MSDGEIKSCKPRLFLMETTLWNIRVDVKDTSIGLLKTQILGGLSKYL